MNHQAPTPAPPSDQAASPDLSPDPKIDAELVRAITKGDQAAFSRLYDRHAGAIYALSLRVLNHPSDAELVVSDVFWEIWRKPEGFDALRGTCRTYLLVMARSRAIDRLRAAAKRVEKVRGARETILDGSQHNQPIHGPLDQLLADERRGAVKQAVQGLGEDQREVLSLAYFEGLTHPEIAQRLGLPLGTVKTRIRGGMQRLRSALSLFGDPDGVR